MARNNTDDRHLEPISFRPNGDNLQLLFCGCYTPVMTDLSTTVPDTAGQRPAAPDSPPVDVRTEPDTAGPGSARPPVDRTRYQISLNEVARRFIDAGLPRSEKTLRRYCTQGKLDAVQSDGPTSREQWYVRESSIAPLIGELLQIHGHTDMAGHGAAVPDIVQHETKENPTDPGMDVAALGSAMPDVAEPPPDKEILDRSPAYDRAFALEIFEHPYVKKLEDRIDRLETKYEAQVRRTEEIQLKAQERLVELQRMTTIGQSKTLADFMLQAKNWIVGGEPHDDTAAGDRTQIS
jgi:hypothetical protein